jgi:hypothetical protein
MKAGESLQKLYGKDNIGDELVRLIRVSSLPKGFPLPNSSTLSPSPSPASDGRYVFLPCFALFELGSTSSLLRPLTLTPLHTFTFSSVSSFFFTSFAFSLTPSRKPKSKLSKEKQDTITREEPNNKKKSKILNKKRSVRKELLRLFLCFLGLQAREFLLQRDEFGDASSSDLDTIVQSDRNVGILGIQCTVLGKLQIVSNRNSHC